jgi:hypothetical protein
MKKTHSVGVAKGTAESAEGADIQRAGRRLLSAGAISAYEQIRERIFGEARSLTTSEARR